MSEAIANKLKDGEPYRWEKDNHTFWMEKRNYNGIPYLITSRQALGKSYIVFVQHGLTSNKETYIPLCAKLAELGFTAVAVDARKHGERRPADFEKLLEREVFLPNFYHFVNGTAQDISDLFTHLAGTENVDRHFAGICGFSMGGYITYMVPLLDTRFIVAAPTAGSPVWITERIPPTTSSDLLEQVRRTEPMSNLHKLLHVSWLIQHGKKDETVPCQPDTIFARKMNGLPEKRCPLELHIYPEVGHTFTPEIAQRTVNWFVKHLK